MEKTSELVNASEQQQTLASPLGQGDRFWVGEVRKMEEFTNGRPVHARFGKQDAGPGY